MRAKTADIVIQGGGLFDLGSMQSGGVFMPFSGAAKSIKLITLRSEFDESGANNSGFNESIGITVSQAVADMTLNVDVDEAGMPGGLVPLDPFTQQGLSFYGVRLNLSDPEADGRNQRLDLQYPQSQVGSHVYVVSDTAALVEPHLDFHADNLNIVFPLSSYRLEQFGCHASAPPSREVPEFSSLGVLIVVCAGVLLVLARRCKQAC